ncbi:iron-sulfur cluster insertion protein ErpA [Cerasicoccus frondis]|uniref:iron-sulfur cluster insertion protein ErpA n=1 Tax=Cerasicoccus frondis TaxID=490090 RepID=UPI0028524E0A|nr:iron-sulfur cluster insertion protein ErpA [Cerasicoccus frondis]
MINLTESAAAQIRKLQAEADAADKLLRVFIEPGGCSGFEYGMTFDEPKADDERLSDQGIDFLVDPASFSYLDGCRIHFDDGLHGKGFEINNPNAASTCGCGRSFN